MTNFEGLGIIALVIGLPVVVLAGCLIYWPQQRYGWFSVGVISSVFALGMPWQPVPLAAKVLSVAWGMIYLALFLLLVRSYDPNPTITRLEREHKAARERMFVDGGGI